MSKPPKSGARAKSHSGKGNGHKNGNAPSKSGGKHYSGLQIAYWIVLTGLIISAALAIYYWIIYAQWAGSLEALSGEGDDLWSGIFGPIVWSAGLGGLIGYPVFWTILAVALLITAYVLHTKLKK